jgi:tetratricopeptide (TPR) repeat protein
MITWILLATAPAGGQSTPRIRAENLFVDAQKSLARGDDAKAEELLMKALQEDGSFTSAIWQMAQIYEKRGKLEHARELILRGLQQEPQASWAQEKLAQLERMLTNKLLSQAEGYMSNGEYERAIPKLSLYLGIKPYDPIPLIQIARCHLALDNLDTSKEYLIQAIERDPTNPTVISLLDEVEARIDKGSLDTLIREAKAILAEYSPEMEESARQALARILDTDPSNKWAREQLKELDLLAEKTDSQASGQKSIDGGLQAVRDLGGPVSSRIARFLIDHILVIVIGICAVLLVINLKRRSPIKTSPLQGSMSLIPILDIVSLVNSNLKTGRLVVSTKDAKGEIFFEKGEIIHARWKSCDGKRAFYELMNMKAGKYFFHNHLPNIKHTISEPLSLLLLSMRPAEETVTVEPGGGSDENEKLFTTLSK